MSDDDYQVQPDWMDGYTGGQEAKEDHFASLRTRPPGIRQLMFADTVLKNAPEGWDGEGSAESIALNYVHALEQRVKALGGNLDPHDGGQHQALGDFYAVARKHVTTDDVEDWNLMVEAWDRYVRIKAAAE